MFGFIKYIIKTISIVSVLTCRPLQTHTLNETESITSSLPVVVLHGLESSSEKMSPFCDWLSDSFSVKVFNIEIGNGEKTSLYTPLTNQLDELCETIYKLNELENGFNFIGMSQGGLLARGYVERCNLYPVKNLITLVTPHGGEFIKSIDLNMYTKLFQEHLSVASYWRNPLDLTSYLTKCSYLPILNNEIETDESLSQKNQIKSLVNFILVWSPYDSVLSPAESGKFSFLDDNLQTISLVDTDLYKKDLLGLKYLNDNSRLHVYETNCSHVDHRNPSCYSQLYPILDKYI
jgi:palmitoyl-protein thioesterase